MKLAKRSFKEFEDASKRALSKIGNILPSLKESLLGLVEWIQVDIFNGRLCANNARERVLNGNQVASEEKVLGISDPDACIIPKGTRPLVFGYKPQLGRTEKGYIAAVDIPEGANSDADQLKSIVDQYISNTNTIPKSVSCDDGYVNKKERESLLEQGVETVSFGGSKGKKLIDQDWDKPEYYSARNKRSMVESTIGILKSTFNLDRFSRRGISAVRVELLTACIFHNVSLLAKHSFNQ